MHKTANVLNKLPKSVQPRAKQHLQGIWMAETRAVAEKAFDFLRMPLPPPLFERRASTASRGDPSYPAFAAGTAGSDYLTGNFHGPDHEEAYGVFDTGAYVGAFGAKRE